MATRDPSAVDAELVALVGELSRRAGRPVLEPEVRAALAPLSPAQENVLRATSRSAPPAAPLGPMAWADIARGASPQAAAARELSGYYTLLAERDALASMLEARSVPPLVAASPRTVALANERPAATPPCSLPSAATLPVATTTSPVERSGANPSPQAARVSAPRRAPAAEKSRKAEPQPGRAEQILGLFAYHRDAPLVARALRLSMAELETEIDLLKLRRKTARLVNGRDVDLPRAVPLPGASGPPVRRRAARPLAASEKPGLAGPDGGSASGPAALSLRPTAKKAEQTAVAEQSALLRAVLREVGPRRDALSARLGSAGKPLPQSVLLARFRAAGLEREFGQRERDLIRALLSRHRMALEPVAKELQLTPSELAALVAERGLTREVEAQRDEQREKLRARKAPRDRVDQVLRQREWLSDLGLLDELDREAEALARAALAQASGEGHRGARAVEAVHRALKVSLVDVRALLSRYKLR